MAEDRQRKCAGASATTRYGRSVSPPQFPSRFALSNLGKKSEKLNSLFSNPCALFKKEYFNNSLCFNHFRTPLQITGGYTTQDISFSASIRPSIAIPFRMRTFKKQARKLCRMRSSKTKNLKLFIMNSSEKTPGGGTPLQSSRPPRDSQTLPHRAGLTP